MEYTQLHYLLFRIGNILNSIIFSALVSIILATAIVTCFVIQMLQERPNNSSKKVRKLILFKSIILIVSSFLVIALFIGRYLTNKVDGPDTLVLKNKKDIVVYGKAVNIDHQNSTLIVVPDGETINQGIVAKVNETPISFGDTKYVKYSGTHIDENDFSNINEGDRVNIQNQKLTFKYKNHDKYCYDNLTKKQIKFFNDMDVNGKVVKSN